VKIPAAPHRWAVTPAEAVAVQRRLAGAIRRQPLPAGVRWVAGVDCAFSGEHCLAAVVLWDAERWETVEVHTVRRKLTFPYVPGLLSFREAPAALAALRRLRAAPDALLVDGQGRAHPRRLGLACHLGLIAGLPAVGCAKSRLVGEHAAVGRQRGAAAELRDGGETVGAVLRTRDGVRPVYVSPGHLCDVPSARELVLRCAVRFRLPEPTRLADREVARYKREGTREGKRKGKRGAKGGGRRGGRR